MRLATKALHERQATAHDGDEENRLRAAAILEIHLLRGEHSLDFLSLLAEVHLDAIHHLFSCAEEDEGSQLRMIPQRAAAESPPRAAG
jgi:hypothetical protein